MESASVGCEWKQESVGGTLFCCMGAETAHCTDCANEVDKDIENVLDAPEGKLPDPSTLNSWLSEDEGMKLWPPVFIQDIVQFEKQPQEEPKGTGKSPRLS